MDNQMQIPKINQWSVFELTFNASDVCGDIFSCIDLEVVFKGPNNIEKTVKGFWIDQDIYKVRFCSTQKGIWTYASSSPDNLMNNITGTLECISPAVGAHGFLRRDEEYKYHFIFDDKTRFFMVGQTYYFILDRKESEWKESIDNTQSIGMDKVRMNCIAYSVEDESITYYWDNLDKMVAYMNEKGMIADLIVFGFGLGTVKWDDEQCQKYARYFIARYAAYPNVIWDLVNEWNYTPKPKEFWEEIGNIFHKEDPWNFEQDHKRLLSIHQQTRVDFQFFNQDWVSHVIFQYGVRNGQRTKADEWTADENNKSKFIYGDEWGNFGIVHNMGRNIPVVNDEYGYIGEFKDNSAGGIPLTREKHRNIIWGIYVAGGYGSAGDKYEYGAHGRPYFTGHWKNPDEYQDIKHLARFFTTKGVSYWRMSGCNELIKSGERVYLLAETGKQYVAYAANGGNFSVDIADGEYEAKLFSPASGVEKHLMDITSGGICEFETQAGSDWVIYINSKN